MFNTLSNIYHKNVLLREFTEAATRSFIERFKQQGSMDPDDQIRTNIEKFDKVRNSPRFLQVVKRFYPSITQPQDPTGYDYNQFKTVLNWFGDYKTDQGQARLLPEEEPGAEPPVRYEDDTIVIYTAYTGEHAKKIITQLMPQITGVRGFGHCVQDGGHYWRSYRFTKNETFYFVIDKTPGPKTDHNYVLIIRPVYEKQLDGTVPLVYKVSDARNNDRPEPWENIIKLQPKLENKKDIFVPRPFSTAEIIKKESGETITPSSFARVTYQAKIMYISLGNLIYEKDYGLLDKDLQNAYINARENSWGTLVFGGGKGEIQYHRLFYPFEDSGTQLIALQCILLSLIYAQQGPGPILKLLPSVANSSNVALKRYVELLTRRRDEIINKTLDPVTKNIGRIYSAYKKIIKSPNTLQQAAGQTVQVGIARDLYNTALNTDLLSLLSNESKQNLVTSNIRLTRDEFDSFEDSLKISYLSTWFASEGGYQETSGLFDVVFAKSNILEFLQDEEYEGLWRNIFRYETFEDIAEQIPSITSSSKQVKDFFISQLQKYCSDTEI